MITAVEIKRRLADQAEAVCKLLVPHGKRTGKQWKCGSIYGEAGDSTVIELEGSKAGVWSDFANESDRGDLLDLWMKCKGLAFLEAFKEAKKFLNIADPQSSVPAKKYARPAPKNVIPLRTTPDTEVEKYLMQERKLSRETIHAFKIGQSVDRMKDTGTEVVFPSYSAGSNGILTAVKYVGIKRTPEGKKIS